MILTIRPYSTAFAIYEDDVKRPESFTTVWDVRGFLISRGLSASDVALLLDKGSLDVEHATVPGYGVKA